jgi:DNA repair protein RecO
VYHKYNTKGIIVSHRIDGENDKRVSILTDDFGFIKAKIQGVRNINSKLRPASQDFCLGEFSLVVGRSGWKIVSAKPDQNIFEILKENPNKLKVVVNVLNLVRKLSGEENGQTVFKIISSFLDFILVADDKDVPSVECIVLLKILHSFGYMRHDPELSIPMSSHEINTKDLELVAPRRALVIKLINESLKATDMTT